MIKNLLISAIAGFAAAQFEAHQLEYMNYISTYGKTFENMEEFNLRLAQFTETNQKIKEHNQKADRGEF